MSAEVVVTLQADTFSRDFVLPSNVKLKALYPRLLTALQIASTSRFADWSGVILETEEGALVDPEETLQDYGVCSGNYLFVTEEDWEDGF